MASNESIESKYCRVELTEAQRLQKSIIIIQARDRTQLVEDLQDIHYVDMKHGVDEPEAIARLIPVRFNPKTEQEVHQG